MPRSRRYSVRKLRIMNPAPASSTSVSASSATISAPVQRRARTPADARAAAFLQHLVDVGLRDVQRRRQAEDDAGAEADRGKIREDGAVHRELDPVRLADILRRGVEQPDADERDSRGRAAPLMSASSTLSTSSCRIDPPARSRQARRARRSRARGARSAPAAGWRRWRRRSAARTRPRPSATGTRRGSVRRSCCSLNVRTFGCTSLLVSGRSAVRAAADVDQLALRLLDGVTPGASRPNTSRPRALRFCASRLAHRSTSGCQRSALSGNLKPSGITPMTSSARR